MSKFALHRAEEWLAYACFKAGDCCFEDSTQRIALGAYAFDRAFEVLYLILKKHRELRPFQRADIS